MLHKRTNMRGVKEMEEIGKERERSTRASLKVLKRIAMCVMSSLCKLNSLRRSSRFRPPFKLIFLLRTLRVSLLYNSTFPFKLSLLAVQIFSREIEYISKTTIWDVCGLIRIEKNIFCELAFISYFRNRISFNISHSHSTL